MQILINVPDALSSRIFKTQHSRNRGKLEKGVAQARNRL